jgi:D-glycerate 3-kinase
LDSPELRELDLWPKGHPWPIAPEIAWSKASPVLRKRLEEMQIPKTRWSHLISASLGLAAWVKAQHRGKPFLLGINGAQGSGKSTTAALLAESLRAVHGLRTLSVSIDDFYLTRLERWMLADTSHPLFVTRGVPGTHDIPLLGSTLEQLFEASSKDQTAIPRFDKASDDRMQPAEWCRYEGKPDVVILEGWCVGSRPQPDSLLEAPINRLEADEDPEGQWRLRVNEALKGDYRALYSKLDRLVLLKIPDFSVVKTWRSLQEQKLKDSLQDPLNSKVMDTDALERFIMHYERITRWNLEILPSIADLTLEINTDHRFVRAVFRPS